MNDKNFQVIGLIGFIISGFFFVAAGIRYGDPLTTLGSIIWLISCVIWLYPHIRSK